MKPRLESLPYTAEDEDVWNFVGCFEAFWYCFSLEDLSADQDRRDADLMLECQQTWRAGWRKSRPDCPYAGKLRISRGDQLVDCGGAL
jgi:hypothetical protein